MEQSDFRNQKNSPDVWLFLVILKEPQEIKINEIEKQKVKRIGDVAVNELNRLGWKIL